MRRRRQAIADFALLLIVSVTFGVLLIVLLRLIDG